MNHFSIIFLKLQCRPKIEMQFAFSFSEMDLSVVNFISTNIWYISHVTSIKECSVWEEKKNRKILIERNRIWTCDARESEKFCVIEWKWDCGVRHKRQQQHPNPFRPIYDALHFVWHAENLNDSEGNCFFGVDLPPRSCFGRPRSVRILCRMISCGVNTLLHIIPLTYVSIDLAVFSARICMLA